MVTMLIGLLVALGVVLAIITFIDWRMGKGNIYCPALKNVGITLAGVVSIWMCQYFGILP